jgi:hypothetical protein
MRLGRRHHIPATMAQGDAWFSLSNSAFSTLAALVIAYLSLAAAPPTAAGHSLSATRALIANAVDRVHKSDRFTPAGATFASRWNLKGVSVGDDLRPARAEKPIERQISAKIPFGCDPAFGPLVHDNFSARCLASVGGRTKLAATPALKGGFA